MISPKVEGFGSKLQDLMKVSGPDLPTMLAPNPMGGMGRPALFEAGAHVSPGGVLARGGLGLGNVGARVMNAGTRLGIGKHMAGAANTLASHVGGGANALRVIGGGALGAGALGVGAAGLAAHQLLKKKDPK